MPATGKNLNGGYLDVVGVAFKESDPRVGSADITGQKHIDAPVY